jgi:ribulose-5-phosphate 4-epimerase/fuculose-1-phosphate aldolase
MTEGYIKFNCVWDQAQVQYPDAEYRQIEEARAQLFALGLIGVYPDGIGFGNISMRSKDDKSFIISGSATGRLSKLIPEDYALVTDYKIDQNTIFCTGLIQASSESLTHAAIYQAVAHIGAVVHVHCLWLWEKLLGQYPTTPAGIEYGTPEMAQAVGQLAFNLKDDEEKIIVMGGHREGILAFGHHINDALQQIISVYERNQSF